MRSIYHVPWTVAQVRSLENHLTEGGRDNGSGPTSRDEDRLHLTSLDLCNGDVGGGGDEECEEKGDHVDSLTWLVYCPLVFPTNKNTIPWSQDACTVSLADLTSSRSRPARSAFR